MSSTAGSATLSPRTSIIVDSRTNYVNSLDERWAWDISEIEVEAKDDDGNATGWGVIYRSLGKAPTLEAARSEARDYHRTLCAGAIAHRYPDELMVKDW